jgi:hypothetical protein
LRIPKLQSPLPGQELELPASPPQSERPLVSCKAQVLPAVLT